MNATPPMLSLILPLHNVEEYVHQTLESVSQQPQDHLEVILVDDGSTDQTAVIAKTYVAKHPNWQLIMQPQQGVSVARNVGTQEAKGEYVAYLDGDDWLAPQALQQLLTTAQQAQADLVQCGFFYAYEQHLLYDNRRQSPQDAPQMLNTETALEALCQPHPLLNNFLWAKVMKREIALVCPNPPGRVAQDAFVMHEIVARCSKVVCISQPLWFYRQRNTGLSGHFSIRRKDLLEAYEMRIQFLQSTHREKLLAWVVPEYLRQVFQHLAAAKRTHDTPTIQAFEAYQSYVQQQYSDIIKQYAPHLWQKLKWEQSLLGQFLCRVKNRLFRSPLLKYSFSDLNNSFK